MFERLLLGFVLLTSISAIPAIDARKARAEAPAASTSLAMKVTTEEGHRIEEIFFRVKINGRLNLLQGLIVKKADATGKLPIMLGTHGTLSSANERQEPTPRGAKDSDVRVLRAYAQRGWLAVYILHRGTHLRRPNERTDKPCGKDAASRTASCLHPTTTHSAIGALPDLQSPEVGLSCRPMRGDAFHGSGSRIELAQAQFSICRGSSFDPGPDDGSESSCPADGAALRRLLLL